MQYKNTFIFTLIKYNVYLEKPEKPEKPEFSRKIFFYLKKSRTHTRTHTHTRMRYLENFIDN